MKKDLSTVEYEVQLKLKEFLESQGVDTLLLWNEIENFVEKQVTPRYSEDWSSEVDDLEDEISDLENNVEEAESAFGRLRDSSADSIKRTSRDLADICKGLIEMKEILNRTDDTRKNFLSAQEIVKKTEKLQNDLEHRLIEVQAEEIW